MDHLNVHSVDFLCWDEKKEQPMRANLTIIMRANLTIIMLDDYFNFLLPTDHGLEHGTRLVVRSYKDVDKENVGCNIYFPLRDFSSKIVTNPSSSYLIVGIGSDAVDSHPQVHRV